jgi:hypothetical protein
METFGFLLLILQILIVDLIVSYYSPSQLFLNALSSTDGSNVRPKNGRNSSPVADCNSRSNASRVWTLSRYDVISLCWFIMGSQLMNMSLIQHDNQQAYRNDDIPLLLSQSRCKRNVYLCPKQYKERFYSNH